MTPTSATGNLRRARRGGFTLVELMVVVVIIGLIGAVAVLALPDPRPSLVRESERFAAAVIQARDQAVLTNRPTRVRIDADGYNIDETRIAWAEGDAVSVITADGAAAPSASISLDSTGVADPATVSILRPEGRAVVRIDQAGQVRVDAAR